MKALHFCIILATVQCSHSSANEQKTPIIDIRDPSSKSPAIVAFCSRESPRKTGLPQHAFVAYGTMKDGKFTVSRALGMHKASAEGIFEGTVPKSLVAESISSMQASSCNLAVKVDPVHLLKLAELSKEFEQSNYVLTVNDCVSYTASVAQALGLEIPAREGFNNLPIQFVAQIATTNSTPEKLSEFAKLRAAKKPAADKKKTKNKPQSSKKKNPGGGSSDLPREIRTPLDRPTPFEKSEPNKDPEPKAPEPRKIHEPVQVPSRS